MIGMQNSEEYIMNKINYRDNARKHEVIVEKIFQTQIQQSIEETVVYDQDSFNDKPKNNFTKLAQQIVWPLATDQAVIKAFKTYIGQKIAALNFASYTNPGGGFLNGAMAQEEAICAQSDLYPVILSQKNFYNWNKRHLNQKMYLNRALYSPDILWGTSTVPQGKSAVITCAAPNKSAGHRLVEDKEAQMKFESNANSAMLNRMEFVKQIAEDQKVDVLILGAWGAGVFGFTASEVAKMWRKVFTSPSSIATVIYAVIPDRRNSRAVKAFKDVFEK